MAQALYEPAPSAASLASLGLRVDDFQQEVEVLPDLWPAFQLFRALSTQWRTSMAGAAGLDYAAIPVTGKLLGMSSKAIRSAFEDVRYMEAEALRVMEPDAK